MIHGVEVFLGGYMSPLSQSQQQMLADNVWLHFFQMGHLSSTGARPTVLTRGIGSRVWDQDGNEYIDALAGLFAVNVGYGRQEIADAIAAQLQQIAFVSPFSFPSLPMIDLAGKLAQITTTGPQSRSFFVNSGSEAVETALKIAKSYQRRQGFHERTKVIARRASYHGTTMGALSVNGVTEIRNGFGPLVAGARHVPARYRYRCPHCVLCDQCQGACADEMEQMVEFENPETIAAIILEPVQNSGGVLLPPPGYLLRVREICDAYGIVFIADEVICGFGRVGGWFATAECAIQPDIITVAKAITSGYAPLGAAIVRKSIADAFLGDENDKFMHGSTFGGHPASCAAALASIAIIEREQLHERSRVMGDYMLRELQAALGDHPNVGDIRGMGLMMAVELVHDRATRESLAEEKLMGWLSDQLKQRGLICRADDRLEPVIQLTPPLVISREEADKIIAIVADAVYALGRKLGTAPVLHPLNQILQPSPAAAAAADLECVA
jgi:adenosylmethionine-8-amino-7-oxononanoate aminotransferase